MPPKLASTALPRCRPFRTTPGKSVPNFNSTKDHLCPPSSTTDTAMAVIPPPSTAVPTSSESNSENILQIPTHATTPASKFQSQSSEKTLASKSGLVNSDRGSVDGNNYEESRKTFDLKNSGHEYCEPEKIVHVESANVVRCCNGSKNVDNLSTLPVGNMHLQSESSVEPVAAKESATVGVARSGNGKRKIVKKTVRIVKKLIKRRVPKRVITNSSENQGVLVKAEDGVNLSEVRNNLNLANDVIEKSNAVDEEVEKISVVNKASEVLSMADDVTEYLNLVNEKFDHMDRVAEKTSSTDEVMGKEKITDEVMQELKFENALNVSEPIIVEKHNDLSGIAYMESDKSMLNLIASSSGQTVPANDLSGINTMEADNIESYYVANEVDGSNLTIRAPDLLEDEKVNNFSGTSMKTKEIENPMTQNQSEDIVVDSEKIAVVNKVSVELLSGQNVGPAGEKCEKTIDKAEGGIEVESDRTRLTERLLLSGEMEALERKKRRKTEIFLGGLDKDTQEDDIRNVFGEAGVVVEIRLVMSNAGKSRGYAFVRFATSADAKNALAKYSKVEICGKQCTAAPVDGNDTIFLGNIDRNWRTEDVVTLLEKAGIQKIDKVTLKADPDNIEKNRGFAFVEFQTCKDAQIALNKLQKKDAFGKKQMVKVAWAQPLSEPAEEEILQVKSVYAEYLPSSWGEENVKDYFKRFGEIENVVLAKDLPSSRRRDFAFINYTTRDAALTCIEAVNRERLDDDCSKVKMAASLAKPIPKRKQMKHTSDLSSKKFIGAKQKTFETSKKQYEPRNKEKAARSSYDHVKDDNRPSTTDELVQILRQQASNKHILSHPRTGINIPDHHFPLPGSKRPFSLVGNNPLYLERRQDFSRSCVESSYPKSGPSYSSNVVGMLSFPYHHRQVPGFASESVNQTRTYPSHFQTREEAPYYADNNMYRRCE